MYQCSEILNVEDAVALLQDLITFGPQVVILSQIAHIEQLLVMLLQQTTNKGISTLGSPGSN